eukprot:COSAG02_NODE_16051_length_1117_cov_1.724951_1_plen_102_part_00
MTRHQGTHAQARGASTAVAKRVGVMLARPSWEEKDEHTDVTDEQEQQGLAYASTNHLKTTTETKMRRYGQRSARVTLQTERTFMWGANIPANSYRHSSRQS